MNAVITLSKVKNSLIAYAHSKGRPEYSLYAIRDVYAAIQSGTDHPLKDLVIRMNEVEKPQAEVKRPLKELMAERVAKQIPLLKKYREKNGTGCWSVLARKTKGVVSRQQLYNAVNCRTTISEKRWEKVEAEILKDLAEES